MQTLRKHLEEECDAYFLKIEKHAVKVPSITDLKVANLTLELHVYVGIFSEYKVELDRRRKQSGSLEAMLQHCTFRLQNKVKGIYSSLVLRLSQFA